MYGRTRRGRHTTKWWQQLNASEPSELDCSIQVTFYVGLRRCVCVLVCWRACVLYILDGVGLRVCVRMHVRACASYSEQVNEE